MKLSTVSSIFWLVPLGECRLIKLFKKLFNWRNYHFFNSLNATPFSSDVLAFAELREPYAKLLYDGGYIIAHGSEARSIQYYHEFPYPPLGDFWVVSTSGDNEHGESMFFDRTKFNFLTTSFAIDSRKGWENELDGNDNCLSRTDKKLKYLLHGCSGRMTLRALTDEERAEVQQYKKEQQGIVYSEYLLNMMGLSRIELFQFLWFTTTDHCSLFQQSQRNRLRWSIRKVG